MSNKGAIKKTVDSKNTTKKTPDSRNVIKKTSDSKNVSKTRVHSKSERSLAESSVDSVVSTSSKDLTKTLLRRDVKATGDQQQRSSQNSTKKLVTSKSSSKDKVAMVSPGSKISKQNTSVSSPRTGSISSPRAKTRSVRPSNDTKLDTMRKISVTTTERRDKTRVQASNSEKRGVSSIYLPKEARSSTVARSNTRERISVPSIREKQRASKTEPNDKSTKPEPRRTSRERKKSRTLSPSEVKYLHVGMKNVDHSNDARRTKDAESRKSVDKENAPSTNDDEYDYEDDFEDYESDFQECTDSESSQISEREEISDSPEPDPIELRQIEQVIQISSGESRRSDEEHMLDSGHYELSEARKRAARMESLSLYRTKTPPILQSNRTVDKTNRQEKTSDNKSLPLSSTDEGFEDGRSGDFTKSPPTSQISFIEIGKTSDEKIRKNSTIMSTRGRDLLNMIKLDSVGWSLFESTPIPYEDFINTYGKLNTQQVSVQTNEDDLDVEIQTETINATNRWTQFPITCRTNLKTSEDIKLFKLEGIGAGEDVETSSINIPQPSFDVLQLNEFLRNAGKVVLSLLEEKRIGGSVLQMDAHDLPFSDGFIKLNVDSVSFLRNRSVSLIHYSDNLNKMLLTIHAPNVQIIDSENKSDYLTSCCIGCVWSTSEPSRPVKLFYSASAITACCFHSLNYNVVFAGLEEGTISLWDLREDETWHPTVTDKTNEVDWTLRSPTYTTADIIDPDSHNSPIVAIRVISSIGRDIASTIDNRSAPIQVCTLNDEGCLIVWSVLYNLGLRIDDLGLAQWGDIRLQKSQEISLDTKRDKSKKKYDSFVDMHVDSLDANSLFLATNSNNVMHATCIGNRVTPRIYRGKEMECFGATRCIEQCPYGKPYFLVGCDDGTVRLHSSRVEKALLQLKDDECKSSVKVVQWSKSKPFTIFVLDIESNIHIWNLSDSDVYPMYSVSTNNWGHITSMQLSPCKTDQDMANQYLALGTSNGRIEIHKLNKGFRYDHGNDREEELDTFLRYVDIL